MTQKLVSKKGLYCIASSFDFCMGATGVVMETTTFHQQQVNKHLQKRGKEKDPSEGVWGATSIVGNFCEANIVATDGEQCIKWLHLNFDSPKPLPFI